MCTYVYNKLVMMLRDITVTQRADRVAGSPVYAGSWICDQWLVCFVLSFS
jgi:hypothetical protein